LKSRNTKLPAVLVVGTIAFSVLSAVPHNAYANELDYRTTVDFIIEHGKGVRFGEQSKIEELSECVLRISKITFHQKKTSTLGFSYAADFDKPLVTTSFDISLNGVMSERLVKLGYPADRFHFHTIDNSPMIKSVLFHSKPNGVQILSKEIHAKLKDTPLKAGVSASATSHKMYWMVPGHDDEIPRKFRALKKAFMHLVSLCNGVGKTDYGVFDDDRDETAEEGTDIE